MHLRRPGVALGSPPTTDMPVGVPGLLLSTAEASCLPRLMFNQVISQQAGPALPAPANSPASLLLLAAFPAFGSFYSTRSISTRSGMPWDPFHTLQQGEQAESDKTGLSKPLRLTGEENREKNPPLLNHSFRLIRRRLGKVWIVWSLCTQLVESSFPGFIHSSKNYLRWTHYMPDPVSTRMQQNEEHRQKPLPAFIK